MTLRARLFALVASVVAVTVVLVTATVASSARAAFASVDAQRTAALVAQVRREFAVEGEQIARRLERIAATDSIGRTASDLRRGSADPAALVGEAAPLAAAQGLDFLDVVSDRGTIISSAHAPARFGYRHPLFEDRPSTAIDDSGVAFLQRVEQAGEPALGLIAARSVPAGDRRLYVIGGRRLDDQFVKALALPTGMRVVIYRNIESTLSRRQFVDASGLVSDAAPLEPLVAGVLGTRQEARGLIHTALDDESVAAIPLTGRDGAVLGVLLVASSGRDLASLVNRIRWSGAGIGAFGILVGWVLSYVVAARITRPIEDLADAARSVAAGRLDTQITEGAGGEVGALAGAFNTMTRELADQRERLVQAERVAAWRELARRLAHELKNPLFPLRLTIDNLRRARGLAPGEFDEVFEEGMGTLSTGLANLTAVVGQFSDFARMPLPVIADVSPNQVVQRTLTLVQPQLSAAGHPTIRQTIDLDPSSGTIEADGEQLGRALMNLVLNAIDAMPDGGELTIRTRRQENSVRIDVADTGKGLTDEERSRLFTPYYTTKQHGTGLGLAIVQSVVADHNGRIRVESTPGGGTTFRIELPVTGKSA